MKLILLALVLLVLTAFLLATRQQGCCNVADNEPYRQPVIAVRSYSTPGPTSTYNPNVLPVATPTDRPAWNPPTPDPRNTPSPVAALKVSDKGIQMGMSTATDNDRFNWPGNWMRFDFSLSDTLSGVKYSKLVVMLNTTNLSEIKNISDGGVFDAAAKTITWQPKTDGVSFWVRISPDARIGDNIYWSASAILSDGTSVFQSWEDKVS